MRITDALRKVQQRLLQGHAVLGAARNRNGKFCCAWDEDAVSFSILGAIDNVCKCNLSLRSSLRSRLKDEFVKYRAEYPKDLNYSRIRKPDKLLALANRDFYTHEIIYVIDKAIKTRNREIWNKRLTTDGISEALNIIGRKLRSHHTTQGLARDMYGRFCNPCSPEAFRFSILGAIISATQNSLIRYQLRKRLKDEFIKDGFRTRDWGDHYRVLSQASEECTIDKILDIVGRAIEYRQYELAP